MSASPEITVYGPRQIGGRNLGIDVGTVSVMLSPDGSDESQRDAERVALSLLGREEHRAATAARVRHLEAENRSLRERLSVAAARAEAAEKRAVAAVGGRRRFFGPVLCRPATPGDWAGAVWLLDPEKRERGTGLRFTSMAEVRLLHPELWIVRADADGVLLDAWAAPSGAAAPGKEE